MIVFEIGKRRRIDAPFAAALEDAMRRLARAADTCASRRRFQPCSGRRLCSGGTRPRQVDLLFGKAVERRFRQAEVLGQQRLGRVADPVGDAERAELGEVAVVEDQDEVAGLVAQALKHVAVAAGEIPDVARLEIIGLGVALRIDDGRAHAPLEDEGPLGGGGVPVQLAHRTRLQPHRNPGDAFGDRQLLDGGLLAKAVADHFALGFLQRKFERRQFIAGQQRIRDIIHEARIASSRWRGRGQGRRC